MKMFKFLATKFIAVLLIACMAFALVGCNKKDAESKFIDEIGGCSETYNGALSEDEFGTLNAAAENYVKEEIVGDDQSCSVTVGQTTEVALADASKHKIPAECVNGAESVQAVEVYYTVKEKSSSIFDFLSSDAKAAITSGNSEEQKVTVYVIKFDTYFKYFTPVVENGETLTKTYFESLFNAEKYKNCTFKQTLEFGVKGTDKESVEQSLTYKTEYTAKFADSKIRVTMVSDVVGDGSQSGSSGKNTVDMYIGYDDNRLECYANVNGSWASAELDLIGFSDIEELTPFYGQRLDHSYFVKTEYGCAIENEKLDKYMESVNDLFEIALSALNFKAEGFVKYYVSEGTLSGVRTEIKINMNYEGVATEFYTVSELKCTDYGSTVVEKPKINK